MPHTSAKACPLSAGAPAPALIAAFVVAAASLALSAGCVDETSGLAIASSPQLESGAAPIGIETPIYEYTARDHLVRLSATTPASGDSWSRGPLRFYAFVQDDEGSVPVYEYKRVYEYEVRGAPTLEFPLGKPTLRAITQYRYSTDATLTGGWTRAGVAFYAPAEESNQATPVAQYRQAVHYQGGSGGPAYHFVYSIDELEGALSDGTVFWAYVRPGSPGSPGSPGETREPPAVGDIIRHPSSPVGAIPGDFAVSPTGSATYSIPVEVPPGTAGMQPSLALTYDSQRGNSHLGMGWALSGLSAITRCPQTRAQDGVIRGVQRDEQDRFCLDGQRLMATHGEYGADGTIYRTERESWVRVVSKGTCGRGPCSFNVTNKVSHSLQFGGTDDSRIESHLHHPPRGVFDPPPPHDATVMVWALNRVEDPHGNAMTVKYTEKKGDFMPASINYTSNEAAGLPAQRKVEFHYTNRYDKPFGFVAGAQQRLTMRLAKIQTWVGTASSDTDATLVKTYKLAYESSESSRRSLLTSVEECNAENICLSPTTFSWSESQALPPARYPNGDRTHLSEWSSESGWNESASNQRTMADVNGDGRADIVGFKDGETLVSLSTPDGFEQARPWTSTPGMDRTLVDMNADGKADIVSFTRMGRVSISLSNGKSFAAPAPTGIGTGVLELWHEGHPRHVADVNGDGRPDIVGFNNDGVRLALAESDGSFPIPQDGSIPPQYRMKRVLSNFGYNHGWRVQEHPRMLADVNGDGRADIVGFGETAVWVALSEGTTFATPEAWCRNFDGNDGWEVEKHPRMLTDVNGDGLLDIGGFGFSSIGAQAGLSDGTSFGCNWSQPDDREWFRNMGALADWKPGEHHRLFADLNGDGRSDILNFGENDVEVYHADGDGKGFADRTILMNALTGRQSWKQRYHPRMLADVNGDGQLDIVAFGSHGVALSLSDPDGAFPDRIVAIDNGVGGSREITYAPLTDESVYKPGPPDGLSASTMTLQRVPMYVVAEHSLHDGLGNAHEYEHSYAGGRIDLGGRGFLGFRETVVTNVAQRLETRTTYLQKFPFTGLATEVLVSKPDRRVTIEDTMSGGIVVGPLHKEETDYSYVEYAHGGMGVRVVEVRSHRYGESGQIVRTSITTNEDYDDFGNPQTTVTESGGDAPALYTCRTYENSEDNWRLGVLLSETVSEDADCDEPLRHTNYEYEYDSRGALTKTTESAPAPTETTGAADSFFVVVSHEYDTVGNLIRSTDALGNEVEITYDKLYRTFPHCTRTQPSETVEFQRCQWFDPAFGVEIASTAPSGIATHAETDGFGRVVRTLSPGQNGDLIEVSAAEFAKPDDGGPGFKTVSRSRVDWDQSDTGTWAWSETRYDGLARRYLTRSQGGENDQHIVEVSREFDGKGRVVRQTLPYYADSDEDGSRSAVHYDYDNEGRVERMTFPDGRTVTTQYDAAANTVATSSPSPTASGTVTNESIYDSLGRVVTELDADGNATTFEYDALGQLVRKTDPLGARVKFTYDSLGRVVKHESAERGMHEYEYDLAGRLTRHTDAKGQRIEWTYDGIGRVVEKHLVGVDGTVDEVAYTYDAGVRVRPGQLASVTWTTTHSPDAPKSEQSKRFEYNAQGLPSRQVITYGDGATYDFWQTYDALGRPDVHTFPDGTTSGRHYSKSGLLTELTFDDGTGTANEEAYTVARYSNYTAAGQVSDVSYGNGFVSSFRYSAIGQLAESMTSSDVGELVLAHSYQYNSAGKLAAIRDEVRPIDGQVFEFDQRGRMVTSQRFKEKTVYRYDAGGNIIQLGARSFRMRGKSKPYQIESDTASGETFHYDDNGNLVGRVVGRRQTQYLYDVENRLIEVREAEGLQGALPPSTGALVEPPPPSLSEDRWVLRFAYDAAGHRIEKLHRDDTRVRYVGPGFEVMDLPTGETLTTKTLFGVEGAIATVTTTASDRLAPLLPEAREQGLGPLVAGANGAGNPVEGMRYHHRHHLRTTALVTDERGSEIARFEYEPYGELDRARSRGTDDVRAKFTGKELDADSDLYYFGARYYDPTIGRFLTPDPAWQYDNPYAYGAGDPTAGIDPDGEWFRDWDLRTNHGTLANGPTTPMAWSGSAVGGRLQAYAMAALYAGSFAAGAGITTTGWSTVGKLLAISVVDGAMEVGFSALAGNRGMDLLVDFGRGAALGFAFGSLGHAAGKMGNAIQRARAARAARAAASDACPGGRCVRSSECFAAGTLVHTADGKKEIQTIEPGDLVLAKDEETGAEAYRKVARVFVTHEVQLYELVVQHQDGARETIRTTGEHPFWMEGIGWVAAVQLQPGDVLVGPEGATLRVTRGGWLSQTTTVYNLEVEDFHTYFVGERGVWVHNDCRERAAIKIQAFVRGRLARSPERSALAARDAEIGRYLTRLREAGAGNSKARALSTAIGARDPKTGAVAAGLKVTGCDRRKCAEDLAYGWLKLRRSSLTREEVRFTHAIRPGGYRWWNNGGQWIPRCERCIDRFGAEPYVPRDLLD